MKMGPTRACSYRGGILCSPGIPGRRQPAEIALRSQVGRKSSAAGCRGGVGSRSPWKPAPAEGGLLGRFWVVPWLRAGSVLPQGTWSCGWRWHRPVQVTLLSWVSFCGSRCGVGFLQDSTWRLVSFVVASTPNPRPLLQGQVSASFVSVVRGYWELA